MSSSEIAIAVQNLSKRYEIYDSPRDRLKQFIVPRVKRIFGKQSQQYFRDFWALKDLSFDIRKGETIGIIGRNGSGKSTLLQIICGTLTPTQGTVITNGRIAALLELGSGFNPDFTGHENIYMNAAVLGLSTSEIDKRYDSIASFADIGDFIQQPIKTYSSGMYVRLAFAVAINVSPDILIVDEALAVGDIRFQNKCLRKINEMRDDGCSVVFVSHSANQVEALCNRAIWLEAGKIKAVGDPAELGRRYVNYMVHGIDEVGSSAQSSINKNEQKVQANPDSTWIAITSQHNKRGNGADFKRIRIQFNDENGSTQILSKPSVLAIEAEIEFFTKVSQPLIALGVFNSLNEPIVHFNSSNTKCGLTPLDGPCTVVIKWSLRLPALRPGEYLISLGADDGTPGSSVLLGHLYDAWTFRVTESKPDSMQGGYIQAEDANISMHGCK